MAKHNYETIEFLKTITVENKLQGIGFTEIGVFYIKKLKNTASAQLWDSRHKTAFIWFYRAGYVGFAVRKGQFS